MTFPAEYLPDAIANLKESVLTGRQYIVPHAGTKIDLWTTGTSATSSTHLLSSQAEDGTATTRAAEILQSGLDGSEVAYADHLSLDFSELQPYGGDRILKNKTGDKWAVELKYGLVHEMPNGNYQFIQSPFGDTGSPQARKRGSLFHPEKLWDFACVISRSKDWLLWIPCSAIKQKYWVGDEVVEIDAEDVADFRIDITDRDWFDRIATTIMARERYPKRPVFHFTPADVAEDYVAANPSRDDEVADGSDDVDELRHLLENIEQETIRGKGSAVWIVEILNRECARRGYGVFLQLSRNAPLAVAIFVPYFWSKEDIERFLTKAGELPLTATSTDIAPATAVLPLRFLRAMTPQSKQDMYYRDRSTRVAAIQLDKDSIESLLVM